MRVLVTGGAGFIGSNVAAHLVEKGHDVRVLDDLSTGDHRNLSSLNVELVEGDVRDRRVVRRTVEGVEVVFHLAARVGNVRSLEEPWLDAEVNVLGSINVLESAKAAGVRRFVYSSSAATFGELMMMPIAESHLQDPTSPYGVSKLAGEKYARCYGKVYAMNVVCLRYFNVYGINQRYDAYGNVIPIFMERLLGGLPLTIYGDGEQTRDFVNVRDVAYANYLAAITDVGSGVYNIGSGTEITINRLAEVIQEASGLKAARLDYLTPRPGEVRNCCADITKAAAELGFKPRVDFGSGLREYCDWFLKDRNYCSSSTKLRGCDETGRIPGV